MVAEATDKPRRKYFKSSSIPFATRATIRSLYVVHCKGPAEIAPLVALPRQKICDLVHKNGWTQERDALQSKREKLETEEVQKQVEQVNQVVAVRSEELLLGTLDLCGEALEARDCKNLHLASGAARNLDSIRRSARNLDTKTAGQPGNSFTLAFLMPPTGRKELNVTPAQQQISV